MRDILDQVTAGRQAPARSSIPRTDISEARMLTHTVRCQSFYMAAAVATAALVSAQRGPARDPLVRENALVRLANHTHVIPDENVGMVPNVGIVVGSRATLVIDPGMGRRNGEIVLKEVARVSKNSELFIASTHFHPEHTTGYLAFPPSAKYINSTTQEAEFEENGMQMVKTFSGRSTLNAELLKDATRRRADITFDREYALDLGGVRVRFLLVGPTHTRGDTGFFVEGDNVLFAGDVVMNESWLAANASSSIKAWLTAFDTFEALKPRTIVPAHGAGGQGTLIAANRAWVRELQERTLALKGQGKSIDETEKTVSSEMQAKHPGWPRANGLAALSRSAYEGR
jgi:glyoxylase-like metal-dependent hydrolase (beta-lactamase superfamily II)